MRLSARAFNRLLNLARTIAELAEFVNVETQQVAEVVKYPNLDRPV